jgi:tetratricopeptide (TPR) repeat protein
MKTIIIIIVIFILLKIFIPKKRKRGKKKYKRTYELSVSAKNNVTHDPRYNNLKKIDTLKLKGINLLKEKNYHEAISVFEKAYSISTPKGIRSATIIKNLVKTSNIINDSELVEKWLNEVLKVQSYSNDPEFQTFGKVQILLNLKRYDKVIIELNKLSLSKLNYWKLCRRCHYYTKTFKALKNHKTALMNIVMGRVYYMLNQAEMFIPLSVWKNGKEDIEEWCGSLIDSEEDKEITRVLKAGKLKTTFPEFKEDIDKILGADTHIYEKEKIISHKEFLDYFKNIE